MNYRWHRDYLSGVTSRRRFLAVAGILAAYPTEPTRAQNMKASSDCRDMTVMEGGRSHPVQMCRDASGTWRETPRQIGGGNGAPAFRGGVIFRGSFEGQSKRVVPPPRLDLRNLRRSLQHMAAMPRARPTSRAGEITASLDFDGDRVSGILSAPNGFGRREVRGTVRNGVCQLTDAASSMVWMGRCTLNEFTGSATSSRDARVQVTLRFSMTGRVTMGYDAQPRDSVADR